MPLFIVTLSKKNQRTWRSVPVFSSPFPRLASKLPSSSLPEHSDYKVSLSTVSFLCIAFGSHHFDHQSLPPNAIPSSSERVKFAHFDTNSSTITTLLFAKDCTFQETPFHLHPHPLVEQKLTLLKERQREATHIYVREQKLLLSPSSAATNMDP